MSEETQVTFEERFEGHPYTWDFPTKCMFLFLHEMERLRPGKSLYQRMLIRSTGMNLGQTSGPNMLRAVKIAINRTFGIPFIVRGNGDSRMYAIDWDNYDNADTLQQYFASDLAHDHHQYLLDFIPY
jgi:hypothetical protein